ncbi:bifunctional helix-turn-helix transcriptional regulator/GNAT family N-acetyltransferase [Oscillatoria sp. CS-180]|uniref:bifunctional helix-turn-helix transcriptional regulator/GNAT family N-acetyltransferase n=1 Tax=Oscillatoria sp. CS-180 TaxID=3021720 RepID=UPI0023308150|nr:bifunctional helix-turn-helix transcriptional regulator/GNAT family N-acetyltransferase [Oscillatoria sp. CS-180]MDB9526835.1 bifunctional helix-turn-helix transcriptional regulator/GNAT family N-acetyltransferase [Oscillatoria sp. CS-180]
MSFYSRVGSLALGSRLRRLSGQFAEDAEKVYDLYDVSLDAKWFPVFYTLARVESASVTEIAQAIGHSHPSVSQIVKEMAKKDLVSTEKSQTDARVNIVKLSAAGKAIVPRLDEQCSDVREAIAQLLQETQNDLWAAIEEVEFLLAHQSFFERVQKVRKQRKCQAVKVVDYGPEFYDDFQQLNYEWIEQYFEIEEADRTVLMNPQEKILEPGGYIFMALDADHVVGTCTLIKESDRTYELAKMAVTTRARGKGIGQLLGETAINKARELGAETVFIESNTALEAAINLYQKLGFRKVVRHPSPYERCNIQMELKL